MLRVEEISFTAGDFKMEDISFFIGKGDYFVLLGESGAGKTTLLEALCGLIPLTKGRILVNDRDITSVPVQKRALGMVYQDQALFPHMTVLENIAYPIHGRKSGKIKELAVNVGAEHLLNRYPGTLSMGETQRVAIARTLAAEPQVLMLDEPMASLDTVSKIEIRSLLRRINADGLTVIHVTHDYEEAISLASHIGVIENGRLVQTGTPDEVFHHPRSRFIANFVGVKNFFRGELEDEIFKVENSQIKFFVSVEQKRGKGNIVFESEAVVLSYERPLGSARNVFHGKIDGLEIIRSGIEVSVNIGGIQIFAIVTRASVSNMKLLPGMDIWASFKSTAVRFIPEEVV